MATGLVRQRSAVMAKTSASPAKRTNRAVLGVAVLLLIGAGSAGVWGSGSSESSTSTTTSVPPLNDSVNGPGARPAETSYSWFDHGMSVEQTDYPMKELSCELLGDVITPDVCAVAKTSHGSFMLIGTEGYWDKSETDADGLAQIPFDLTVFTTRTDQKTPRAVSVMDGYFEKAFTKNKAQIDLYKASINGNDVLVLVKRLSDNAPDAYSFSDSVQVIAASSTGAPTVVATYEGSALKVGSDGSKIVVSSLRYKATQDSTESTWFSRITLSPSESDPAAWIESVTSGPTAVKAGQGMTLMGSHTFAVDRSGSASDGSNI